MHFIPKKNLINLSFEVQLESRKRILSCQELRYAQKTSVKNRDFERKVDKTF